MPLSFIQKNITVFLRKKIILIICHGLGAFSLAGPAIAQCVSTEATIIPDNELIEINFSVSGLTDNDLASPTQGICGVEIDFMHEYLGDLTITLVSPAGTTVQLVGPVTTAITPTNLSRWNISFAPCMAAANPDAGFAATWSNLQPWQVFTTYTGVYHPNTGCLEDFNTGSANGVWKIIFEDHDVLQTGSIARVSLIFCNPAGLACNECEPNAGTLSPPVLFLCEGDLLQSSDFSIDFQGNPPSPGLYTYVYLLNSGNSIVESGTAILAAPTAGSYTFCGLSYLNTDAQQVNALLSGGDYNQLHQAISNGSICAELTDPCVVVQVQALPDTIQYDRYLCAGESFSFGGEIYSTEGIFYQTHDGPGSCDTVFRINIDVSDLALNIIEPGMLSCQNGSLMIVSEVTGNFGLLTYTWTTPSGNIVGSTTSPTITINQPGRYFVTVSDSRCSLSASVRVVADEDFPKIFLKGGLLNCNITSVDLEPIYVPTDASVMWSGPNGFNSTMDTVTVTVPGTYNFTVVSQLGCFTTKSVEVEIDTATHPINIIETKDCSQQTAFLSITDLSNLILLTWTGPNGYLNNSANPVVTQQGLYNVNAVFSNGCQRNASFYFDADFNVPDVSGSLVDTLNCNEVISLFLSSSTPNVNYHWMGPEGFSSNQDVISINQFGTFVGTVTAPNGCFVEWEVEIHKGDDIFDFTTFSDTITCGTDTVLIGIIAPEADLFHWINYNGQDSLLSEINVTVPGLYNVIATDTNSGCSVEAKIFVQSDYTYPHFRFRTDTITCLQTIAELNFIPLPEFPISEVYWELPDASIVPGPVLYSSDPGLHKLVGISPIGCVGIWNIYIPFDTLPPVFFLETDTLDCTLQQSLNTIISDSLTSIQWTGPNLFNSNQFNPIVVDTGLYVATGFGVNGCSTSLSVYVHGDFELPEVSIVNEELTCLKPDAILAASSPEPVLSYTWKDQLDNIIGTNATVSVTNPGTYIVEVEGLNHCIEIDSVTLDPIIMPLVTVTADTLSCTNNLVTLMGSSDAINPVYTWFDFNGNTISLTDVADVSTVGPFIFSVIGDNGCESRDTILVPTDTLFPQVVINMIGEVRCQIRDFMLDASASTPSNIEFSWETTGGMILTAPDLPIIESRDTGVYVLTIRNPENGCTQKDSIHVTEHPDAITLAYINVKRPVCDGDENAEILVTTFDGGVGPFVYTLNGTLTQTDKHFKGLPGGMHLLEIMDAAGCIYDTTVFVKPASPYIVDAGPDQEIYIGESALLLGSSDIPDDEFLSQDWDSTGVIFCPGCAETTVGPYETSTFKFLVTSVTGCVVEDLVTVIVLEEGQFFIPNIFTPNKDGINDEIRFNASTGISKVLNWNIFDRWGNAVFGKTNFLPDDISVYWDGSSQGSETLNPGVFAYIVEIELVNGTRRIHHGTITLLK